MIRNHPEHLQTPPEHLQRTFRCTRHGAKHSPLHSKVTYPPFSKVVIPKSPLIYSRCESKRVQSLSVFFPPSMFIYLCYAATLSKSDEFQRVPGRRVVPKNDDFLRKNHFFLEISKIIRKHPGTLLVSPKHLQKLPRHPWMISEQTPEHLKN